MHNDYVMENVATDLLNDEVVSLNRRNYGDSLLNKVSLETCS